ncbi:hypothetical protein L1987_10238 [Smallanthus sonchifolius]|uniref:Uncharacterized protein n=1 Tax=Smallanthus sonchifolius TaxID=185202 RepID=A0ACB9JRJ9_9ASTR|nr:hypothetical protein L1987_10238 [Smallanthus sonchifolius]
MLDLNRTAATIRADLIKRSGDNDADLEDTVTMSGMEAKFTSGGGGGDVEFVKCECCGLTEECTPTYIATARESNQGRWICELCVEAVKDEMERSCSDSEEEALDRHMRFCKNFRSTNPTEDLISAVKQLLIRSLDSPRSPGQPENSNCHRLSSLVGSNACR